MTFRNHKKFTKEDCMAHPTVNMGIQAFEQLRALSVARGVPIGRLVAIALETEMEQLDSFRFDIVKVPPEELTEENTDEAQKLYTYIMKNFKSGVPYATLLLCRLDFGVPEKRRVMIGIAELLKKRMMEEVASTTPWGNGEMLIKPAKDVAKYEKKQRRYRDLEKLDKGVLHEIKIK